MLTITNHLRSKKNRPLLNEINVQTSIGGRGTKKYHSIHQQKKQFWHWFKTRPELNAPVTARVNDTITTGRFYKEDGTPLGRNKQLELQRFITENFFNERLKSIWFDAITSGSGFGWKGEISPDQIKEALQQHFNIELKTAEVKALIDEDTRTVRRFEHLPSSTVTIQHNEYDIEEYTQNVGGQEETFSKEEIIHFKFLDIDGKVDGYTPIESLAREFILLYFIKENMVSYIRNGGYPKKVFTLLEENANSANHQYLIEQLQTFGALENRHGNLVLTGKIDIEDLEETLKDMEYEKLAKYVAGNIAYALHIPNGRLPYNLDGKANTDAGGLSEAGYWSIIESDQRKIEDLLNTQLFIPQFKAIFKFDKNYRIDTVREAQVQTLKLDAAEKIQTQLARYQKQLTLGKLASIIGCNESEFETMKENPLLSGLMGQNQLAQEELKGSDAQASANTKKQANNNNPKGADMTGTNNAAV